MSSCLLGNSISSPPQYTQSMWWSHCHCWPQQVIHWIFQVVATNYTLSLVLTYWLTAYYILSSTTRSTFYYYIWVFIYYGFIKAFTISISHIQIFFKVVIFLDYIGCIHVYVNSNIQINTLWFMGSPMLKISACVLCWQTYCIFSSTVLSSWSWISCKGLKRCKIFWQEFRFLYCKQYIKVSHIVGSQLFTL